MLVSGAFAASESGADSLAASGAIIVRGALAVTESGADTFAASGLILVSGGLSATESGADLFDASGSVSSAISGSLAATETGSDSAAAAGVVTWGVPPYVIWQYEIAPGLQAQVALLDAYNRARALYEKYIGPP